MVSEEIFKRDHSLVRLNVGEKGGVIFRFLDGGDGKPIPQPTTIFLAGRDIPYEDSFSGGKISRTQNR